MSVRWSEQDLQHYLRRGQPAPVSERAWQSAVVRLLKQHGYVVYHTFDSRKSPSGFPDIVAAKVPPAPRNGYSAQLGTPLLCVELKTDTGQVTPAQAAWLEALAGCTGVVAEIWRPSGWEEIVERLRG